MSQIDCLNCGAMAYPGVMCFNCGYRNAPINVLIAEETTDAYCEKAVTECAAEAADVGNEQREPDPDLQCD